MSIPAGFDAERLRALYPYASWSEIQAAFPGYSRETLYAYASRLGLVRTLRHRETTRLDPILATLVNRRLALRMAPFDLHAAKGTQMKTTRTKTITTTTRVEYQITADDIRKALALPKGAVLFIQVPGGGDWSNCALDLDEHPITTVTTTTEEKSE